MVEFGLVFDDLDNHESRAHEETQHEVQTHLALITFLSVGRCPGHRESTRQQEERVEGAEAPVQMRTRFCECTGVEDEQQKSADNESAEHHDFRGYEQPHSKSVRFELLFEIVEMVGDFVFLQCSAGHQAFSVPNS